ncbi:TDT family transporter [Streptococcus suis]|uniref:TDT family transporter n=1 Tax=Streptococcus suis TaxID=1307 RepID=UPI000CF37FAD|nr:TDT family transporter [Streptococcus suis]NQI71365.1 TDT family transporter [Streptococcus suis]
MKRSLVQVPLALSGLLLALVALANLLAPVHPLIKPSLQALALLGYGLLFSRIFSVWSKTRTELGQPIVASCFATLFMGLLLLVASLPPLPLGIGKGIWLTLVALYGIYIVYFSIRFISQRKLELVFPSWFIVYVGFAMVGVTAPVYQAFRLGCFSLIFAGISFAILLPVVVHRLLRVKLVQAQFPLLAIFAAPTALLLTAYLQLAEQVDLRLLVFLLVLSQSFYLTVVLSLRRLTKNGFSPLFAAFTFPFVSSAISLKLTLGKLVGLQSLLSFVLQVEIILATLVIAGVAFLYVNHLSRELVSVWSSAGESV